ncbi:MAG: RdgB/HAM1 family non-canonical purine NTP pyrophosphatase [Nitrospirae bacterium]|uniref:RdgB/HAM1 family non-canonical purine NTP pyrophosphatase n=1 Tax=Candidatus Magnetobacterium casense TaxID=1455061 RepID=UPI00058F0D4D|nr:RdgB/HAM1 family non-canonical purine NTP pyrophosphatase [Candidatus Magnetobacterium casensis]MBF0336985.1 RdgB/HAM1 family non-canonical purine NTP pyrophosphatase [Nitrospirota bacterium]
MNLYLATNNKGKIRELNRLFEATPYTFFAPGELLADTGVLEDGTNYHENAYKKAFYLYQKTGVGVVAEDSGLEVEALAGAPGVYSARFAALQQQTSPTGSQGTSDADNIAHLLRLLTGVPASGRGARFVSVLCLIEGGVDIYFEGEVRGSIIDAPMGDSGFGYDPVFVPDGYSQTFAQLGQEVKNAISHRAMAVQRLKEYLKG